MKLERDRLAKAAYKIRKEENLQTRIRDKDLDLYLEVRKEKKGKWVRREFDTGEEEEDAWMTEGHKNFLWSTYYEKCGFNMCIFVLWYLVFHTIFKNKRTKEHEYLYPNMI